jgi:hypothetical protein
MPASEQIQIKRGVLNELIRSGQQMLDAWGDLPGRERFERALREAKSERARVNSAKARASRRERQTGARRG